ncbi:hypothetical protein AVEN_90817-1 [Araneus ventricosus]|uniref:Uncharacterized protein n=1 Tax=Araneus ventricosus TaxID=182803 RepID=A0A4Y2JK22_ARAVE|nr:hypothetical protein AVEN_90817-1 [Araneus ventricosus]
MSTVFCRLEVRSPQGHDVLLTPSSLERERSEIRAQGRKAGNERIVWRRDASCFAVPPGVITHRGVTPGLPKHAGSSEERSPRQQSDTEVGVPIAITGHGPTPPEGGTSRHLNSHHHPVI